MSRLRRRQEHEQLQAKIGGLKCTACRSELSPSPLTLAGTGRVSDMPSLPNAPEGSSPSEVEDAIEEASRTAELRRLMKSVRSRLGSLTMSSSTMSPSATEELPGSASVIADNYVKDSDAIIEMTETFRARGFDGFRVLPSAEAPWLDYTTMDVEFYPASSDDHDHTLQ